jgi:hypothetical protein
VFEVLNDLDSHSRFGGFNRRDFQYGNEARALVFIAVQMACQGRDGFFPKKEPGRQVTFW